MELQIFSLLYWPQPPQRKTLNRSLCRPCRLSTLSPVSTGPTVTTHVPISRPILMALRTQTSIVTNRWLETDEWNLTVSQQQPARTGYSLKNQYTLHAETMTTLERADTDTGTWTWPVDLGGQEAEVKFGGLLRRRRHFYRASALLRHCWLGHLFI